MNNWDRIAISIILALLLSLAVQAHGSSVIVQGQNDCRPEWGPYAMNAAALFPSPVSSLSMPDGSQVVATAQGATNFYAIAHGYFGTIYPSCGEPLHASSFAKQQFAFLFLATCDGMCSTVTGTFADAAIDSAGYCGMGEIECSECWYNHALPFQDRMFREMAGGLEPGAAFDAALNQHPQCRWCIRSHHNLVVEVPTVRPEILAVNAAVTYLLTHQRGEEL